MGVAGVRFTIDGVNVGAELSAPPYEIAWNSASVANGAHQVEAVARDAAGNQRRVSVTITVANDLTAPDIAITSPAAGATSVAGTITLAGVASDGVGVAGVQFTIDGVNVGAELSAPPYEVAWNSASVANGAHEVAAVARDAAGNRRTVSVNVIVDNGVR